MLGLLGLVVGTVAWWLIHPRAAATLLPVPRRELLAAQVAAIRGDTLIQQCSKSEQRDPCMRSLEARGFDPSGQKLARELAQYRHEMFAAFAARLSAWGAAVRQHDADAQAALGSGDRPAATQALERIVAATPGGVALEDLRAARADALARLSALALGRDDARAAAELADRGLALGQPPDVVSINLHVVRGRALEKLGRTAEAVQARAKVMSLGDQLLHEVARRGSAGASP